MNAARVKYPAACSGLFDCKFTKKAESAGEAFSAFFWNVFPLGRESVCGSDFGGVVMGCGSSGTLGAGKTAVRD